MVLPSSGIISMSQIAAEVGDTGTHGLKEITVGTTLNDCSPTAPNKTAPYQMSEWYGYNHTATAAAPGGFSGNPGNTAAQSQNPTQDSDLYMSWNVVLCANHYAIHRSNTSGGSFSQVGRTTDTNFTQAGFSEQTSRYWKVYAVNNVSGTGSATSELHLRTTPTLPQGLSLGGEIGGVCPDYTETFSWTNGSSPGTRQSHVIARWKLNAGSWSSWTTASAAVGATTGTVDVTGASDSDTLYIEAAYADEGTATVASDNGTIVCTI